MHAIHCLHALPIQEQSDKLNFSVQALESELSERVTHCETLEKQYKKEAENCQLMEVCTLG